MIVKVDLSLFEEETNFINIDRLFALIFFRKHELFLESEDVFESRWYQKSRSEYTLLLKESINRTVQNSRRFDIELSDKTSLEENKYFIEEGLIFLDNKILIFVENSLNDSLFIKGIVNSYKSKGKKVRRFIEKNWIEFRNCGGKNDSINQIQHELNKYRNYNLKPENYMNAIVILDSDKKSIDDTSQDQANTMILDFCTSKEIECHILEKREMENYLSIESILESKRLFGEDIDVFSMMYDLSPEEIDYYDFQHLDTRDFKTKKELPKLFISKKFNQEIISNRCAHQKDVHELKNILLKINNLL